MDKCREGVTLVACSLMLLVYCVGNDVEVPVEEQDAEAVEAQRKREEQEQLEVALAMEVSRGDTHRSGASSSRPLPPPDLLDDSRSQPPMSARSRKSSGGGGGGGQASDRFSGENPMLAGRPASQPGDLSARSSALSARSSYSHASASSRGHYAPSASYDPSSSQEPSAPYDPHSSSGAGVEYEGAGQYGEDYESGQWTAEDLNNYYAQWSGGQYYYPEGYGDSVDPSASEYYRPGQYDGMAGGDYWQDAGERGADDLQAGAGPRGIAGMISEDLSSPKTPGPDQQSLDPAEFERLWEKTTER